EIERQSVTERRLNGSLRSRPIVRVDPLQIAFIGGRKLSGRQTEDPAEFFGPGHPVAPDVPLITTEARQALCVRELGLASPEFLFVLLSLCDIQDDAHHTDGLTRPIVFRAAFSRYPAEFSVGLNDLVFLFVAAARFQSAVERSFHARTVIGMNSFQEDLNTELTVSVRVAETPADVIGPQQMAGCDLPLPYAHAAAARGQTEALLARAQRLHLTASDNGNRGGTADDVDLLPNPLTGSGRRPDIEAATARDLQFSIVIAD